MMRAVFLLTMIACSEAALAQNAPVIHKMTYAEAKAQLPRPTPPDFWISDMKDLDQRLAKLTRGHVSTLVKSPGGRPLYLVTYGSLEKVKHDANFNSAVGGRDLSAYMDKAARTKPVIYFLGPVHGQELEGLAGLMSLIEVMETGHDLRGKEQPELRRLADQCRLLIVPSGNPDGMARFEPRSAQGMGLWDVQFWAMGTWADDRIARWPDSKRLHPRIGPKVGFMGCYFDDAGINPMHDEFFLPMSTATPALLRVAADEGPDMTVSLHSHAWEPAVVPADYAPLASRKDAIRLAERFYALLDARNLPHQKDPMKAEQEGNGPMEPFNLISALYHVSGTTAFTVECPQGIADPECCHVTPEQILDIQLSLYEAMMGYELELKQKAAEGK